MVSVPVLPPPFDFIVTTIMKPLLVKNSYQRVCPHDCFLAFLVEKKVSIKKKLLIRLYIIVVSPVPKFLVSLGLSSPITLWVFTYNWLYIYEPYLTQMFHKYYFPRFSMGCACRDIIIVKLYLKFLPLISIIQIWCVLYPKLQNLYVIMILIRLHPRLIVFCIYNCIILITHNIHGCVVLIPHISPCVIMGCYYCILEMFSQY